MAAQACLYITANRAKPAYAGIFYYRSVWYVGAIAYISRADNGISPYNIVPLKNIVDVKFYAAANFNTVVIVDKPVVISFKPLPHFIR